MTSAPRTWPSSGRTQVGKADVCSSDPDCTIRGYTWQMPMLENLNIAEGRGFTEQDDERAAHVAIIGTDTGRKSRRVLFRSRLHYPRLHLADADAREPEHCRGARVYRAG